MKKLKFSHPTERMLIFIIVMLIGALIAILWFYGERLNILWQQSGNGNSSAIQSQNVNTDVKFYIQTAIKSLYNSQPATDTQAQRLYIPEAKIYLPLTVYSRTIVYRYGAAQDGSPEDLTLTSTANTNALPTTFDDVPCLQRHVIVLINSRDGTYADGKPVKSVKLADGRTLSLYKHDAGGCSPDLWGQGDPDKIIDLLEQAQSY